MKRPLSEELRPKALEHFCGHAHLLGAQGLLSSIIASGRPLSLLFWGPPGCGKTTLAKLYMKAFAAEEVLFHPASHGIADLKRMIENIEEKPLLHRNTIVFVDEIHRLNKAQQDSFLPYLENGTFILIGATTENPSFAINSALLSRLRVLRLEPLEKSDLKQIILRAKPYYDHIPLSEDVTDMLIQCAEGDARHLLNLLENIIALPRETEITTQNLPTFLQKKLPLYDRNQDQHYNLISALHKSVRGSDPDAALYWFSRMLQAGEDPHYIARRLLRIAIEDIGLADPQAQSIALHSWETYERLGSPEGDLALAQAVVYLALSPKSNASYKAFGSAKKLAEGSSNLSPPKIILNACNSFMKDLGHAKGYQYDHDAKDGFSGQNYFPDTLPPQAFYHPIERGFERELKLRKDYFNKLRSKREK